MFRYVAAALLAALLASGGYSLWLRNGLAEQALELAAVVRERDNLRSELTTAKARLRQSEQAQVTTAEALSRAQEASRELAVLKDWIRGNEDAPIPDWFVDLLNRLGFGVRP